jgi:hypothetical protein
MAKKVRLMKNLFMLIGAILFCGMIVLPIFGYPQLLFLLLGVIAWTYAVHKGFLL